MQAFPLDLNSDDFYPNRRDAIDKRLDDIVDWSFEQLSHFATERWSKSCGISGNINSQNIFFIEISKKQVYAVKL